jgi:hypothetical protein
MRRRSGSSGAVLDSGWTGRGRDVWGGGVDGERGRYIFRRPRVIRIIRFDAVFLILRDPILNNEPDQTIQKVPQ